MASELDFEVSTSKLGTYCPLKYATQVSPFAKCSWKHNEECFRRSWISWKHYAWPGKLSWVSVYLTFKFVNVNSGVRNKINYLVKVEFNTTMLLNCTTIFSYRAFFLNIMVLQTSYFKNWKEWKVRFNFSLSWMPLLPTMKALIGLKFQTTSFNRCTMKAELIRQSLLKRFNTKF